MTCDCYHVEQVWETNWFGKNTWKEIGVCWGTKEKDRCSCGGDESKCDFYPEKRQKAEKEKTTMDYISKNIEDMTLPELKKLCDEPEKYNMTFGDYMKIINILSEAKKMQNDMATERTPIETRVAALEHQLALLNRKLSAMFQAFAEEE